MKIKRLLALLVSVVTLVSVFVGCASTGSSSEAPAATVASSALDEANPEASNEASSEKTFTIGISVPVLSNPFWRSFADFGEAAAKELGMEVTVVDANQNDSQQLDQIMGLISSGVDGIVVTPNTSAVAESLLAQAEVAGIPVVIAERYPGFSPDEYDGESYVGYIGVDNTKAGYNIAQALYDAGCRTIVGVSGTQGIAVADERSAGLAQFIEEHPDMVLLQELRNGELREYGLQDIEDFLSAYPGPGFDGVWCYNDDTALGVLQGLENNGLIGEVLVGGMDLMDEAVTAIQNGEMLYSTGGQWAESAGAVVMLFDALNGIKPNPSVLEIEIPGITLENVDAYFEQFIEKVPEYDIKSLSQVFNPDAKTSDFVIELK